jgi:hypothetical protein
MERTSPHPDNWPGFINLANEALKASQPKTYRRFVSLMLEPHFHNHILLQLQWAEEGMNWYRSTWLKHEDAPKFTNPIEQLKYIGKTIAPTLSLESGKLATEKAEPLLNLLRHLSINPYIDNNGSIVLDGCVHTLTFGTDYSVSSSFKWNYLPEEYKPFQKVVDLLEMFCHKV